MEKLKKITNIVATVFLALTVIVCFSTITQVMRGEQPHVFQYQFYEVASGSMEPNFPVGAHIVVKDVDVDSLQVGDVITFTSRDPQIYGYPNTHRIINIETTEDGTPCFVTQGDANPNPDTLPVYEEDVCGKVIYSTTAIYWLSLFFAFVRTGPGFVTVIIFPLMFIGYLFTKDFVRTVNKMLEQSVKDELNGSEGVDHEEGRDPKTE